MNSQHTQLGKSSSAAVTDGQSNSLQNDMYGNIVLERVASHMAVGVAVFDLSDERKCIYISQTACRILGIEDTFDRSGKVLPDILEQLIDWELEKEAAGEITKVSLHRIERKQTVSENGISGVRHESDEEMWLKSSCLIEEGDRRLYYITIADATDAVKTAQNEKLLIERYRMLSEVSSAMIVDYEVKRDRLAVSVILSDGKREELRVPSFRRILRQHRLMSDAPIVIHRDSYERFIELFEKALSAPTASCFDCRVSLYGAGFRWTRLHYVSVADAEGAVYRVLGRVEDIQEERDRENTRLDLERALRRKAELDVMTGLYNKSTSQDKIRALLAEQKQGSHSALMVIDIDDFKLINDRMGHNFGDSFLKQVAAILKKSFREQDIVGRFGGDEFIVFIGAHGDRRLSERKGHQIIRQVSAIEIPEVGAIHCSIGIAVASAEMNDYETLFERADMALYAAKRQGKNRCVVYNKAGMMTDVKPNTHTELDRDGARGQLSGRENIALKIFSLLFSSSSVSEALTPILETMGKSFCASRMYVFELDERDGCTEFKCTYEWYNKYVGARDARHSRIGSNENVEALLKIFYEHKNSEKQGEEPKLLHYRDMSTAPEPLRALIGSDVRTLLLYPMFRAGVVRGAIGFEQCDSIDYWTQEQVDTLAFAVNIAAEFLMRQQEYDRNVAFARTSLKLLREFVYPVYVVNPRTRRIVFANERASAGLPQAKGGTVGCDGILCFGQTDCEQCRCVTGQSSGSHGILASEIDWNGERCNLITVIGGADGSGLPEGATSVSNGRRVTE